MSAAILYQQPAWQTEELQDEWIEPDDEADNDDDNRSVSSNGSRSLSLTEPLAVQIRRSGEITGVAAASPPSAGAGGTFLVREDVPAAPLLPKTPGRNKKGIIKDFFSPLPLERMFEPPSPPVIQQLPVPKAEAPGPSPLGNSARGSFIEGSSTNHPFTFAVPRQPSSKPLTPGAFPQAQSTPGPSNAKHGPPATDPRLRLFQFQYDTFTRDHLSAIVDSIAVNTPSGGAGSRGTSATPENAPSGVPRISLPPNPANSHLRSAKRLKLSPNEDYYGEGEGEGASIARPKIFGKDYVGESQSLMQQIKQARDYSTISTAVSTQSPEDNADGGTIVPAPKVARRPPLLRVPSDKAPAQSSANNSVKKSAYSSLAFRQQAANLMAQIKSDVKGPKRIFSDASDASCLTTTHEPAEQTASTKRPDSAIIVSPPRSQEKENNRGSAAFRPRKYHPHSPARKSPSRVFSSSARGKQRASPRKVFTPRSTAGEHDSALASKVSKLSVEDSWEDVDQVPPKPARGAPAAPGFLAPPPPAYPSSTARSGPTDDLNRFVSSSTASGTTLTAGSAPSFVKHAGPVQITRIMPVDVPNLPDRVGKMVFDKVMLKWVKATASATARGKIEDRPEHTRSSELSDDPFRDIDSLKEDDQSAGIHPEDDNIQPEGKTIMSVIDEAEEHLIDEEEAQLNSFSFDGASRNIVQVMTGVDDDDDDDATTDSADYDDELTQMPLETYLPPQNDIDSDSAFSPEPAPVPPLAPAPCSPRRADAIPVATTSYETPLRASSVPAGPVIPRSAMKSGSATPVSAMKKPAQSKSRTPADRRAHRRSVSFSDGRKDGPISGLDRAVVTYEASPLRDKFVLSARSKRIEDMMDDLQDDDPELSDDESPSKASSVARRSSQELQPLQTQGSPAKGAATPLMSRRAFSRSQTYRPSPASFRGGNANATFLTECSFAIAHDRLVEVITDVQPYEPHWEDLEAIDLSSKNIESVARLKEFLPRLGALTLNSNQVSWLSGIPSTVRQLSAANNLLSSVTSYSHLLNLESLNISNNEIDSLQQLACLRHLRELRADKNRIASLDGLQKLSSLVKLSVEGNCLQEVDVSACRWARLETLDVSHNRIDRLAGLPELTSLILLNADGNRLRKLSVPGTMAKLRILRLSGNRLVQLDAAPFPNVRTLYADNNALRAIHKLERLSKLENLSVRNQDGQAFALSSRHVRDVKRLYLSGNALSADFFTEPCYNLVYLELAACGLTALPARLGALMPNLRALNVNYNFLEDAAPFAGLRRLRKLTAVGLRFQGTKPLIRALQHMPDLELLDSRMNPCTLGWYLPLLVKDVPGALAPESEKDTGQRWAEMDARFRRGLPDAAYVGRLAYRGLVMRACAGVRMLDGVEVGEKERRKARALLEGILHGKGEGGLAPPA